MKVTYMRTILEWLAVQLNAEVPATVQTVCSLCLGWRWDGGAEASKLGHKQKRPVHHNCLQVEDGPKVVAGSLLLVGPSSETPGRH